MSKGPHLMFIRGFCTPEWLECINTKVPIDPELCQRHLHLDPTDNVRNSLFTSPQLPSASGNAFQLPFTTTCSCVKNVRGSENLKQERTKAAKQMATYHDVLPRITPLGDSIVRKYDLLSRNDFVIEQTVSMSISIMPQDSWTGKFVALTLTHDVSDGVQLSYGLTMAVISGPPSPVLGDHPLMPKRGSTTFGLSFNIVSGYLSCPLGMLASTLVLSRPVCTGRPTRMLAHCLSITAQLSIKKL